MKSKIKYIVFLCLLSVTLSLNVNAITLKETTTSGDEFDTIEANTTIIGITKFTPQEVITAAKATKAGADDVKLYLKQNNNEDDDYETPTIYIYYGEIGGWYSLDENNEATYIEDEDLIDKLSNLSIYYVNNEVKKFTIDVDYEVDNTKLPKGVTYEDNKLSIESAINSFLVYTTSNKQIKYGIFPEGLDKIPNLFSDDDWEVIAKAVRDNNTSMYNIGDTKIIKFDLNNDGNLEEYNLKILNKNVTDECSSENYSQTSCGFVIGFDNVITLMNMNNLHPEGVLGANDGGWQESAIRQYLNNNVLNLLSSSLKEVIIDTRVISGYGDNNVDNSNFITNDKLYLLSNVEVWGTTDGDTVSSNETRQLDYYNKIGVTNNSGLNYLIKNDLDSNIQNWWLRSAFSERYHTFNVVNNFGRKDVIIANREAGVSPAFRIG